MADTLFTTIINPQPDHSGRLGVRGPLLFTTIMNRPARAPQDVTGLANRWRIPPNPYFESLNLKRIFISATGFPCTRPRVAKVVMQDPYMINTRRFVQSQPQPNSLVVCAVQASYEVC